MPFYFHEIGAIKSPVLRLFSDTVMALEGALVTCIAKAKGVVLKSFLGPLFAFP